MPIKLKLNNITQVEPGFEDELVSIWKERWKALNEEILHAEPRMKDFIAKKNGPAMNKLKGMIQDKNVQDYERTQLMCLPFERFWLETHNGVLYLAGLTKPIILTDLGFKHWQGPRYTIYVPRDAAGKGTSARFHFIPEGFELYWARHPHHHTYSDPNATHPLDLPPSTCWGTFGTMSNACCRAGDFTNLFRTLHQYTSRVDMHSLLTHPFEACHFFKPMKASAK